MMAPKCFPNGVKRRIPKDSTGVWIDPPRDGGHPTSNMGCQHCGADWSVEIPGSHRRRSRGYHRCHHCGGHWDGGGGR